MTTGAFCASRSPVTRYHVRYSRKGANPSLVSIDCTRRLTSAASREAIRCSPAMQRSAAHLAAVVAARAGPRAAHAGNTPSLVAIAGAVDEEPAAIAADLHAGCLERKDELERRVQNGTRE